jgi:hypothetical protein
VALAGTVVATASVLTPAVSAGADPIGECTTTAGEIVVVDLAPWRGDVERGCAAILTTGYAALYTAGFTTAGDEYDGPAFICRINNDPPTKASPPEPEDPCITTPPPSAYWSYWHADAGQNTWTPSQLGAMTYQPPPGSVDAWVFGDGSPPPFLPRSVRANNSAPTEPSTTTTVATPAPTNTSPGTGTIPPGSSPSGASPAAGATTSSTPHSGSPTSGTTGGTATTSTDARSTTTTSTAAPNGAKGSTTSGRDEEGGDSGAVPKIVDVSPSSVVVKSAAGSPVALIVGGILAAMVAGGAGLIAWLRRRSSHLGEG